MDKSKKRSIALQYALILFLAVAIGVILFHVLGRLDLNVTVDYDFDPTITRTPLTGFAPDARNKSACRNSDLVFIRLRWADWEKEKGVFDTEALESVFNIAEWKQARKHAVLRFVCDIPGTEDHLDIPQWLYDEVHDGTHYDTALGKGYSPNYANQRFQEAHRLALRKLAEYCNRDSFVAFVELGSIGHWGEWHASDARNQSLMPDSQVCETYISLYDESFVNALMLTRRPYQAATEANFGCYNDMVGNTEDTEEWLKWMKEGGVQETSGRPLTLSPVKNKGKTAPVGGEFASDVPMAEYLNERFGEVLASISSCEMTFIGPNTPDLTDEDTALARESILRRIGYRIFVRNLQMKYDFSQNVLHVTLTWKNAGNAGFFFDWPVTAYVYDADKHLIYWETLPLDLRDLNTGDEVSVEINVPFINEISEEFYLGAGITDYQGRETVRLANDPEMMEEDIGQVQILYHYQK